MTDKDKKRFSISQNVVVIVYKSDADSEFDIEEEKAKILKLLTKTQIEYDKNKISDAGTFGGVSFRKKKSSILKARIDYIDEQGNIDIKFTMPIFMINNLTVINEDVL
jgi:hypothetical protein